MPITPGNNLEPLMAGTDWSATQGAVEAFKINAYAAEVAAGKLQWLPVNRRIPIIVDQEGKIMSGHHRLIAARIASVTMPEAAIQSFPGLTSRPAKAWRDVRVR